MCGRQDAQRARRAASALMAAEGWPKCACIAASTAAANEGNTATSRAEGPGGEGGGYEVGKGDAMNSRRGCGKKQLRVGDGVVRQPTARNVSHLVLHPPSHL